MDILMFAVGSAVVCSVFGYIFYTPFRFLGNVQEGYRRG